MSEVPCVHKTPLEDYPSLVSGAIVQAFVAKSGFCRHSFRKRYPRTKCIFSLTLLCPQNTLMFVLQNGLGVARLSQPRSWLALLAFLAG